MRRNNQELKKKKKLLKQKQIFEQSFFEFSNGNTGMTKHQFVIFILKHLDIIDQEQHIDPWLRKFEELDINRMGYLNAEVRLSHNIFSSYLNFSFVTLAIEKVLCH
jgi:hypothetical protein